MERRHTNRDHLGRLPLDEVVRAGQAGRADAIAEIARRFRDMACAVAATAVPPAAAEDVAHDALIEVLGSLQDLRQPFALPLLVRLAVRKYADRHRRGHRDVGSTADDLDAADVVDEGADPAILAERRDLVATVRAALQGATEPDRYLLELRYLAEWPIADLALAAGLTEGAVRKRLHDARRRLRPALAARGLAPTSRSTPMVDPTSFLGNLYLADGAAVDENFEPLAVGALPELAVNVSLRADGPAERLVTGMKVIDTIAPLTRGGRHDIVGPFGTGHLVLVRQLVDRANRSRPTACVAVGSRHWHKGGFSNFHKFANSSTTDQAHFATILAAGADEAAAALDRATRLAHALGQHRDVIIAVDDFVANHAVTLFDALQHGTTPDDHSLTVLHVDPSGEGYNAPERPTYDGRLSLSLELAARGIFPAIDPETSSSALLTRDNPEGLRAQKTQAVLAAARDLTRVLTQGLIGGDDQRAEWIDPSAASTEIDQLITRLAEATR